MAARSRDPNLGSKILDYYRDGKYSTGEIAALLSVSQPTVYNHLRRHKLSTKGVLPRRYRGPKKVNFTETQKNLIVKLHNEGKYITDIQVELGSTIGPVRRVFRELGLESSNFKPVRLGERFGYVRVIAVAPPQKTYKGHLESRCVVECHCGVQKEVFSYNLRSGNTRTCGCKIHLTNRDTPYIRIFHGYLSGARMRGLSMELSLAQVKFIVSLPCFYCGEAPLNNLTGRKHGRSTQKTVLKYNGIDRVDSQQGYMTGNVLPACHMCNRAKSDSAISDFVSWLSRLGRCLAERQILDAAHGFGRELESMDSAPLFSQSDSYASDLKLCIP
jgi:DNA-binding transcriptional ArsR family regulator